MHPRHGTWPFQIRFLLRLQAEPTSVWKTCGASPLVDKRTAKAAIEAKVETGPSMLSPVCVIAS